MKANIIVDRITYVGVCGKNEEDIKNKVANEHGYSKKGKSIMIVRRRND